MESSEPDQGGVDRHQPIDFAESRRKTSILMLDKVEQPFPTQLARAADILGVDYSQSPSRESHGTGISDPRYAYAFRWLLKRMLVSKTDHDVVRLNDQTWRLLHHLIPKVPISRLAIVIKDQKFMQTLSETLQALQENVVQSDKASYSDFVKSKELDIADANSNPPSQDVSQDEATTQKRKRDDVDISHPPFIPHKIELYSFICRVVYQLDTLASDPDRHGYAAHQLTASLKSPPNEAAAIFGYGMFLINDFLQRFRRGEPLDGPEASDEVQAQMTDALIESCLSPLIDFWKNRSQAIQDKTKDSVDVSSIPNLPNHGYLLTLGCIHDTCCAVVYECTSHPERATAAG